MNEKEFVMWSGQTDIVLKTLLNQGRYIVKKEYVEQKFGSTAWVFQLAYQYLAKTAKEKIRKPKDAESPVWVYKQRYHIVGTDIQLLKLNIPREQILLFDSRKWNKILNLSYLGRSQEEEREFDKWLSGRGITDSLQVFTTPYYPMEKNRIMSSWERIVEPETIPDEYLQGMTWEIKREWIME